MLLFEMHDDATWDSDCCDCESCTNREREQRYTRRRVIEPGYGVTVMETPSTFWRTNDSMPHDSPPIE